MVGDDERHVPVLLQDAIQYLNVRPGGTYVDATVGMAGHASAIARLIGPGGRLVAFDRDPEALAIARQNLARLAEELAAEAPTVELVDEEFSTAGDKLEASSVDGILADFGMSSMQLGEAHRGFSFQADGPLDMRMNPRIGVTAAQVVNRSDEKDLANLIYEFGEERRSRRIARAIVRARPITTTAELARVVAACAPTMKSERHFIHPATRTFQALRIYVNDELGEIKALLEQAPRLLKPGGRLVVISFHSLEDRLAKDALRDGAKQGIYDILTRKPLTAAAEEMERNPRSRSAKMRAAERVEQHKEFTAEGLSWQGSGPGSSHRGTRRK